MNTSKNKNNNPKNKKNVSTSPKKAKFPVFSEEERKKIKEESWLRAMRSSTERSIMDASRK